MHYGFIMEIVRGIQQEYIPYLWLAALVGAMCRWLPARASHISRRNFRCEGPCMCDRSRTLCLWKRCTGVPHIVRTHISSMGNRVSWQSDGKNSVLGHRRYTRCRGGGCSGARLRSRVHSVGSRPCWSGGAGEHGEPLTTATHKWIHLLKKFMEKNVNS